MYKMLEFSSNYVLSSWILWKYHIDEIDDSSENDLGENINVKKKQKKHQPNRMQMMMVTQDVPSVYVLVTIPMYYLTTFWESVDLPLINYELELDWSWWKACVLVPHHNNLTGVIRMITNTKRYIAVATLSLNDNIKLLKHLRLGFKRKIYWDNYRSKITTHHNNNNFFKRLIQHLGTLTDSIFTTLQVIPFVSITAIGRN